MKIIKNLTSILMLFVILAAAGCQKKEEAFLKRNTRDLSFPYTASEQTFTIRATGDWTISDKLDSPTWTNAYSWLSLDKYDGTGDGATYEKITVKCDANMEPERTATIYLHGSGQNNVPITITQANGVFEFKAFANGNKFDVSGTLKLNAEATGIELRVPYIKALGTEVFNFTFTSTSLDLVVPNGEYSISTAGDGFISIPVTGTPKTQGIVSFTAKASKAGSSEVVDFGSYSTLVRGGYDEDGKEIVLVEQDFNKLPWGGDCIAMTGGVVPVDANLATLTIDAPTKACGYGDNGHNSGLTSTIKNNANAQQLYEDLGMTDWTGYRNYMRPGYLQLGAASGNSDGQPGSIISPKFTWPAACNHVLVTFKIATWATDCPNEGMVGLTKKHDGIWMNVHPTRFTSDTKNKYYYAVGEVNNVWSEVSVVIAKVDGLSDPAVYFAASDNWWGGGNAVPGGRFYIDDIKVVY